MALSTHIIICMKRNLIVVILVAVVGIGYWLTQTKTKTVVVNMSNPASPASVFGQSVRSAVDGEWYQSANCTEAQQKVRNTPNSLMVYNSSVAFAALNKKLKDCQIPAEAKEVLRATTNFYVCKLPEQTKELTEDVRLGMASMYAVEKHEQQFGVNLVPYSGSKTVLQALLAGDIEWGWMGKGLARKQGDKIECPYTTDASENSKTFIGDAIPSLVIPDHRIEIVVYSLDADTQSTSIESIHNNTDLESFAKNNSYKLNQSLTNINDVNNFVERMYDTWSD